MYAIVKTGGKQYKVAPGDKINVEKLAGEVGDKVALDAICIVDGKSVEANPEAAAKTKVEAIILNQFKDKKQLVFKFKKRKGYKKLRGHRQPLTRIQIISVGSEKMKETKPKKAAPKAEKTEAAEAKAPKAEAAKTETKATKSTKTTKAAEKTSTKSTAKTTKSTKASDSKATDEKPKTTKKTTAKKTDEKSAE